MGRSARAGHVYVRAVEQARGMSSGFQVRGMVSQPRLVGLGQRGGLAHHEAHAPPLAEAGHGTPCPSVADNKDTLYVATH